MDGKTGSAIVGDGIEDEPGESVVAFQHVSETGHKVTNDAFAHGLGRISRWRTPIKILTCPT